MIPVVIIGLGRIGAGNIGLAGEMPLSHLAAIRSVSGLSVTALVDPDPQARAALQLAQPEMKNICIAADLDELPQTADEIIAICTPAETHAVILEKALIRKPRIVVVEKPFASSLAEAHRMACLVEGAGSVVRVNFNRRFDVRHLRWRAKAPPSPLAIVMRYGKGLMNYGSHLVDLLLDWYGPVESVQALGTVETRTADPSPSFRCRMAAGFDATAVGIDGLDYDQFEIDIFDHAGRIESRAGGADFRRYVPVDGLHYQGYRHLAEIESERDTGPVGGFTELYSAIVRHITDGASLPGCDGRAALAGIAVLEAIERSMAAGGKILSPEIRLRQAT